MISEVPLSLCGLCVRRSPRPYFMNKVMFERRVSIRSEMTKINFIEVLSIEMLKHEIRMMVKAKEWIMNVLLIHTI